MVLVEAAGAVVTWAVMAASTVAVMRAAAAVMAASTVAVMRAAAAVVLLHSLLMEDASVTNEEGGGKASRRASSFW